jgi:L-lactate dehydrogenase (cytochrome)
MIDTSIARTVWKSPKTLKDCHTILDLRELARRSLPNPIFHHLEGGAETEVTARRNIRAFDDAKLIPRCLVDVGAVRTSIHVLGQDIEWPVICAPTGASRFYHPEGERALAHAVAGAGTLYGLSTVSTCSLEEVAAASPGSKLFQLYVFKNRDVTRGLIERCRRSGYSALCLTVDMPVTGKRERDLRTGWGYPIRLSLSGIASFAMHAPWLLGQLREGRLSMPNVAAECGSASLIAQTQFIAAQLDPSVSWRDVREMIELWGGPFAIKGVMSVDDARLACDVGATAVIVSNHGGRQLDGAAASIEVLPEIAEAIGAQIEVILDGGIRRGVHVLKALALGAKACSVGRACLYGLAAAGESGVTKALDILRTEIVRAMQLSGCSDVADIDSTLVRRF